MNLTNAPPIHAYTVSIQYNPKVLGLAPDGSGIDPTGGLLGNSIATYIECIGGTPIIGNSCSSIDGAGVLTLSESISGSGNSTGSSGILFTVRFNILLRGVSQIHLLKAEIVEGASAGVLGSLLAVQLADGYFSNMLCGGMLCQPPVPSFTVLPLPPISVNKNVTFDATGSKTPNLGGSISFYTWFWNEAGSAISTYTSTRAAVIEKSFFIGNTRHFITLTVNDTYGVEGYTTMLIQVVDIRLDLSVDSISASPVFRVLAGTPVNITAVGDNLSTDAENVTLEIVVGGTVLANKTFPNVPGHTSTLPLTKVWDTHGFAPKIYRVQAIVPPVRDSSGKIIEDDVVNGVDSNNMGFVFVEIVEPAGSGLISLSLVETTGLGIIVLAGVGAAAGLFSRRRRTVEPLLD